MFLVIQQCQFNLCVYVCSPTSDGSAACILANEEFVKRHGLQAQAVEIIAQSMTTDFPSTFEEKSAMKIVSIFD